MDYEYPLSDMPTMKGISLDLPFLKFRYVKVQNNKNKTYDNVQSDKKVTTSAADTQKTERTSREPISIVYSSPPEIRTLGLDPMVSYASVIHELQYGRIQTGSKMLYKETSYPVQSEYVPHRLDLFA